MPEPKGDVTLRHFGKCGCGGLIVSKTWEPDPVVPVYICLACGGEFDEDGLDDDSEQKTDAQQVSDKEGYLKDGGSY